MDLSIGNICIDTNDLAAAVAFWPSVTGYEITKRGDTTYPADPHKRSLRLSLQSVPEPRIARWAPLRCSASPRTVMAE